jgi:hypothetical protein
VRVYNGQHSRWYQAAIRQKAGRITAAGMTKEVSFEPVGGAINNRIDAYEAKYKDSPYLKPMALFSPDAQAPIMRGKIFTVADRARELITCDREAVAGKNRTAEDSPR